MSISSDFEVDKVNCFDLEDEINDFDFIFAHSDEDDEISICEKQNSGESYDFTGESSTGSNESSSSGHVYKFLVPHDVRPEVPDEFKPNSLMRFKSVDDAIEMYKIYAEKAGFDVRLNTQRKVGMIVKHRYVVCNRMGSGPNKSVDTNALRNVSFKVTNCSAKIIIKRINSTGDYKIDKFFEMHNHPLEDIRDLRSSRQLSFSEKEFIVRASTVKLGATKAHKLRATLRGGYAYVNAKVVDYKNFKRNSGNAIGFKDAQIIVNKMKDRQANYPNYYFDYKCDENKVLNAMFWADETDRAYFTEFGDVVSFDATFRTNKYSLVFVPFTVIDHHRSSVTVGAGLLSTESIDSYKWLLQQFLKCHGKQPVLVLTDQDPAIKQAIESVFPNSIHRLCMWHILKKLRSKVTAEFLKSTDFETKFKKLVWDLHMDPDVFEEKWKLLIKEHNLDDDRWFSDLYNIRHSWIPGYFKEIPMCGLMKTTSRSESMNSFFNTYSQSENFLINFMLNYDNALQKQRNTQRENDHKSKIAKYVMKFPLNMEEQAASVFTSRIFFGIQKEMHNANWFCKIKEVIEGDGWELHTIIHNNKKREFKALYKVELKLLERDIKCSCEYFNRFGVLCRHVFKVFMEKDFDEIPEKYVLRRWRKDVISSNYELSRDRFGDRDADIIQLINKAYINFECSLDLIRDDKEKLTSFVDKLLALFKEYKKDSSNGAMKKHSEIVENLMSVTIPEDVVIKVPDFQNNKGCGKKRLVGALEKSILNAQKEHRKCSGCGKKEPHNLRTCPVRLAAEKQS